MVTADTARPVGLLYAGSSTNTVANPIQDVLNAFISGAVTPTFPTNPDHAVACAAVGQSAVLTTGAQSAQLSPQEVQRATAAKEKFLRCKYEAGPRCTSTIPPGVCTVTCAPIGAFGEFSV